jgi:integrase
METEVARKRRQRALNDGGAIDQRSSGRWRLRVSLDGRQVTYGTYDTEDEAATAQARWKLTHLLPADDPDQVVEKPASVAVGGVRCDEWFERWQEAKSARRSRVRVGKKRGGAESTAARDRAQWSRWWKPAIGDRLPHTLVRADVTGVLTALETAGRAPNTIRTHWVMVQTFLNWLVAEKVIAANPMAEVTVDVDPALDRTREIVVPDFRYLELLGKRLGTGEDRLVFELLLGTGGRRSEVAGMVAGDVDLPAKRVWVREPVVEVEGRLVRNPTPKGGRNRAVIVGPQLAQLLREHLMRKGMPAADEPLLASPRGKGFRWNNYLARTLRPAIVSAATRWAAVERRRLLNEGLPRHEATVQALAGGRKLCGLTPHHLRHTAAALLWAAGASDIEVQLILGHREIDTSRRLYAHLLSGSGESAAARVEQLRAARRAS